MKKTLASALLMSLAALSAGAYAGQNVEPNDMPFQGVYGTPYEGPTRAQVQADLATAKIAGQVSNVEPNDMPFQGVYGAPQSGLTRTQVRADLAAAKAAGQVSGVEPDDTPFAGVYLSAN
ncbi:MAG: DUF4148 domain-containing protein [Achromobacter sp.]|uniref:DUF4148 domain-containing protein n=1 Tax=Achromobacter pulmonis TaxID=1389932 RepID=A0A6S7EE91_9BURK|nr:DUF4148 domain-containing protein [Achromobacter pulmonis]MPT28234.1 DUF4148 domain-containing protein [Achromobacter sp.]CAB3906984.1 hypothetical protein LMG26788_04585 [Achromobacter pulmonis]